MRADVWGYASDIKVLLDTGAAVSIANPALWPGMTQRQLRQLKRKLAPTSVDRVRGGVGSVGRARRHPPLQGLWPL